MAKRTIVGLPPSSLMKSVLHTGNEEETVNTQHHKPPSEIHNSSAPNATTISRSGQTKEDKRSQLAVEGEYN